jgi:hypothetical protein
MLGAVVYSQTNHNIEYRLNAKFMLTEAHRKKHVNGNGDSCGQRYCCLQTHLPAGLELAKIRACLRHHYDLTTQREMYRCARRYKASVFVRLHAGCASKRLACTAVSTALQGIVRAVVFPRVNIC